ncbi:MAG: outer membrane beta-barrel protein [Betaproteobacteria bacterium]|nr:outer membrane beta-barrel protein [Betaproteobacteria bacterium]
MRKKYAFVAAIAVLSLSSVAVAHEAGEVFLRVGVIHAAPDVSSSRIKVDGVKQSGTSADVGSDTQIGLTATYMVMPRFGIELLAATPFTHDVKVKGLGPIVDGKLGEVSHLPPTVSAQFFFLNPKSRFQPYVGLGLTYTMFYNEKLTRAQKNNGFSDFKMEDSLGVSGQVGMDVSVGERLFVNAAVWRVGMSTTAKAKAKYYGQGVKVDVDVDPWVYFLGVGYKF